MVTVTSKHNYYNAEHFSPLNGAVNEIERVY